MNSAAIFEFLSQKGADREAIAAEVIKNPETIHDLLEGPVMVTAANIIRSAAKIARAKPFITERIVTEILKVERAKYLIHGRLSPEGNNVACGQAIDTFTQIYDQIRDRKRVRDFINRQRHSSRPAVRKKAEKFTKMHKEVVDG